MSANTDPKWEVDDRNSQGDPDHVRDSDGNEGRADCGMFVAFGHNMNLVSFLKNMLM